MILIVIVCDYFSMTTKATDLIQNSQLSGDQEQAQAGPVSNDQHRDQEDEEEGQAGHVEFHDGLVKAMAGNKEIHAYRWREITQLHISKEDQAQVHGVDAVPGGNGQDDRDDNDQGREDIQHHAQYEQKQV